METGFSQSLYNLEIDGKVYQLRDAEFNAVLYEMVTALVFQKLADRVCYVLDVAEQELTGSGSSQFDPLCVSLYRHLKVERCYCPGYFDLTCKTQAFRLHAIVDALAAVAFFLKGGDAVPHMIVGRPGQAVLSVLDRGTRTMLTLDDPGVLAALARLIPT
ncbi:MAG: hypothetical protein AMS25_01210 [Gemmatimonas sp. SM23_52]|nr:MAG: hypothetical protein AMS25_01210 [Gemmatimonas sp. SM23_52]